MPRPQTDPAIVEIALDLVRTGASFADAAEGCGVSQAAVRAWCKKAGVKSTHTYTPDVVPAHMRPPPPAEPVVPLDTSDLGNLVKQMIQDVHAQVSDARAGGNLRAAGQAAATLQKLATVLKQIEASKHDDASTLHVPRIDLERARMSVRARWMALRSRPLLCAHCARRLSIAWGTGATDGALTGATVTP